jgi:S1-C subfamily serine protease
MPSIPDSRSRAHPDKSVTRTVLVYLNLVIVAFLSVALVGVTRRIGETAGEKRRLEDELKRTRASVDLIKRAHDEQLADARAREDAVRDDLSARDKARGDLLTSINHRLSTVEQTSRRDRVDATANVKREIEDLRSALQRELGPRRDVQDTFRDFEGRYGRGVVLIYTEFDYVRMHDGKEGRRKTVSGWGSGFFVDGDGHIVTNKHVIQAWKFDQDLATMAALDEIKIDEDSLRIACWESGTFALDGADRPQMDVGFNNFELGNLRVLAMAPDHLTEHSLDSGIFGPKYKTHDLDNNDLVVLKVDGAKCAPLPCTRLVDARTLHKLDQVMALGYPRGQNGLETARVETSPSIGTVRKVENTIHVTASIIPGNSGGPLIGPDGEVVGIVTRIYSETLGICIKIDHALDLIDQARAAERAAFECLRVLPCAGPTLLR